MKLCISSEGASLDSRVDPRFGRCRTFIFVDSDTMAFEAVDNSGTGASGGAGIQAGQLVASTLLFVSQCGGLLGGGFDGARQLAPACLQAAL